MRRATAQDSKVCKDRRSSATISCACGVDRCQIVSKILHTMPANDPGKLTAQQSADILVYMLQVGKFPAGKTELSADENALSQITFPPVPPAPQPVAAATTQVPSFPAAGNMAQLMRAILFPSSNLIFTVQSRDPAAPLPKPSPDQSGGGFSWSDWGAGIYTGWELVDYAAVAIAESAPLMLTPGRRCENGRLVPVQEADWIKLASSLPKRAGPPTRPRRREIKRP